MSARRFARVLHQRALLFQRGQWQSTALDTGEAEMRLDLTLRRLIPCSR